MEKLEIFQGNIPICICLHPLTFFPGLFIFDSGGI